MTIARPSSSGMSTLQVGIVLLGLVVTLIAVNLVPRGPINQNAIDNWWATHHQGCTEEYWGWPFAAYSKYPNGYVNPNAILPWDIDPVYSGWDPIGLLGDLMILLAVCSIATLGMRRRRPAERQE